LVQTQFILFTAALEEIERGAEEGDGGYESSEPMDFDSIINNSDIPINQIVEYTHRLGASMNLAPKGHAFFNGKHFEMGDVSSLC
jgi:hypothetical protein